MVQFLDHFCESSVVVFEICDAFSRSSDHRRVWRWSSPFFIRSGPLQQPVRSFGLYQLWSECLMWTNTKPFSRWSQQSVPVFANPYRSLLKTEWSIGHSEMVWDQVLMLYKMHICKFTAQNVQSDTLPWQDKTCETTQNKIIKCYGSSNNLDNFQNDFFTCCPLEHWESHIRDHRLNDPRKLLLCHGLLTNCNGVASTQAKSWANSKAMHHYWVTYY